MTGAIDLRSDTVTRPTPEMRRAMAAAHVGDDVFGDDPTVNELERRTAEILAKPAAVYMPSGTMTNQVALRAHTEPGDEVFLHEAAHMYAYEAGGPAALSGVMCRLLGGRRGIFSGEDLRDAIRPANVHFPRPRLVCIENTHNRGGGSVWPIEQVGDVAAVARGAGLRVHLDGARLWNACIARGVSERAYARHFDSVSVCFSKGLGAPVGSALAGDEEFIHRARRVRKMFGGGMRQAGIIAAGALFALEHHRERLADDHANARALGEGLGALDGLEVDAPAIETNIVMVDVAAMPAPEFVDRLHSQGVLCLATSPYRIRMVTSLAVGERQIEDAVRAARRVLRGAAR
jgi:threonine aldolase